MSAWLWVARKELRELMRDKRVRNAAIVTPMFIILFLLGLIGFIGDTVKKKENQTVHVVQTKNSFVDALQKAGVKVVMVPTIEAGDKLIKEGKSQVVLEFPPDFDAKLASKSPVSIVEHYDVKETKSQIVHGLMVQTVSQENDVLLKSFLKQANLSEKMANPIDLQSKPVQVGEGNVSDVLVSLLPYLITIYAFFGGFGSGPELVAGEKEKSTLETLLITPASRTQLAFGKFVALATICFLSSMSAFVGILIAGGSGLSIFKSVFPNGLGLGILPVLTIVLVLVPTVSFFAGVLLAVSAYAKNLREAQQLLAIVNIVVILPAVFSQFIGFTDLAGARWISFVPVLNTSVALRQALLGKTDGNSLLFTLLVQAGLAAIFLTIAIRMFRREQVLVRV